MVERAATAGPSSAKVTFRSSRRRDCGSVYHSTPEMLCVPKLVLTYLGGLVPQVGGALQGSATTLCGFPTSLWGTCALPPPNHSPQDSKIRACTTDSATDAGPAPPRRSWCGATTSRSTWPQASQILTPPSPALTASLRRRSRSGTGVFSCSSCHRTPYCMRIVNCDAGIHVHNVNAPRLLVRFTVRVRATIRSGQREDWSPHIWCCGSHARP